MTKKSIEDMRDCVKKALEGGCDRGHHFHKMRHAIILELVYLGYQPSEVKDILSEWNKKCERPLGVSEARSQLFGYVDWVLKLPDPKISCKTLGDYCIGKEECQFHFRLTARNRQQTKELPFNRQELGKFLEERYKADGYVMMLIVDALRYVQVENATGELILVGVRHICSVIRDRYKHQIDPMTVHRKMNLLRDEGVIQLVVKGKAGMFAKKANGYRFLSWKHPSRTDMPPIITDMCNNKSMERNNGDT